MGSPLLVCGRRKSDLYAFHFPSIHISHCVNHFILLFGFSFWFYLWIKNVRKIYLLDVDGAFFFLLIVSSFILRDTIAIYHQTCLQTPPIT